MHPIILFLITYKSWNGASYVASSSWIWFVKEIMIFWARGNTICCFCQVWKKIVFFWITHLITYFYPPTTKASREVANLTEEKIHIHLYMVSKNLSVSLWSTLNPNISGLAKQNGLKKIRTSLAKTHVSKKFISPKSGQQGQKSNILMKFWFHLITISK